MSGEQAMLKLGCPTVKFKDLDNQLSNRGNGQSIQERSLWGIYLGDWPGPSGRVGVHP